MIRNDYRRAFIMLRPALPGYGGHARLERRTATGSLYVVVTAPEDAAAPEAALTGRRNGEYYAAALGPLRRDRRGQWTLAVPFDPRNIGGRPLEAYNWLTIVRAAGGAQATGGTSTSGGTHTMGGCAVALNGNLEGSCELDAAALAQAVCALYAAPETPAADLPSPGEPDPVAPEPAPEADMQETEPAPEANMQEPESAPETNIQETEAAPEVNPRTPESAPEAGAPQAEASPPEDAGDVKIYVRSKARVYTAMAGPERRDPPAAEPSAATGSEAAAPAGSSAEPEAAPAAESDPPQSAAAALGLDASSPWTGALEPLRRLFAENPPAEDAPQDGYTYVRAPMPAGSGFDACYIGLRATGGAADGLRYAIPGASAAEPPAGMDGYAWSRGFWIIDAPVE